MTGDATWCDGCGVDIALGEICVMTPQDETLDGLPLVKIVCAACWELTN